jgi:tetratricopeptide (TPR) repeat protein
MKRLFIFTLAAVTLFACDKGPKSTANPSTDESSSISSYKKLYEKSMKLKDFHTAIAAIQFILMEDSTNGLRDSLPELYGAVNNLQACLITTDDALKRYPKEEKYKNIKVLCLQQTGDLDGQFALLKELFETTNKPQYVAQIAAIQISTGNLKDAKETIDMILSKFENSKDSLEVFIDENNKQQVPVKAAAWNMKGYIYMQQKNIEKAKDAYFKALEIYPAFVMPKRNLEAIFARK